MNNRNMLTIGGPQFFALFFSLAIFTAVFEMVRRRMLLVEYSVLWLLSAGLMTLLIIFDPVLIRFSRWLKVAYSPATMFMLAILFILGVMLQMSVRASRLTESQMKIIQKMAIIDKRWRDLSLQHI